MRSVFPRTLFCIKSVSIRQPYSIVKVNGVNSSFHSRDSRATKPLTGIHPLRNFSASAVRHRGSHDADTIYALSTASGRAAIAVIRVSGPACTQVYNALCPDKPLPKPRVAAVRTLYAPHVSPTRETTLDHAAMLIFIPGPKTVTGEDILELHTHGGPAIVSSVLRAVSQTSTSSYPVRYAEPGEYTRRAFFNDRMDLLQVEALSDILSATTAQQAKLALRGTSSKLAAQYEEWRRMLLYARGELEALIDFSEDQHFDESPNELAKNVAMQVEALIQQVEIHRANAVRGELLRNGINVAFLGEPNVGKSSLLNCIVGRDAAIVSAEAGTTRDIVEVGIDLSGWFCKLGDMAGLRSRRPTATPRGVSPTGAGTEPTNVADVSVSELVGVIEQEGIKRAKQRALTADIVIVVCSIERDLAGRGACLAINDDVQDTARRCMDRGATVLFAVNKADYLPADPIANAAARADMQQQLASTLSATASQVHFISCKHASSTTPQNPVPKATSLESGTDPGAIQSFLAALTATLQSMTSPLTHPSDFHSSLSAESLGATERHRLLLDDCLAHLTQFLDLVRAVDPETGTTRAEPSAAVGMAMTAPSGTVTDILGVDNMTSESGEVDLVYAAECLRGAADCLARITGKGLAGDTEEVLGVVFEKFCVGK